jgi:hypothetical protein
MIAWTEIVSGGVMLSKNEIIQRLARHRPIAAPVARRKVWVRWAATIAMISMLPLAVAMIGIGGVKLHWGFALMLAGIGSFGVLIAWLAASKFDAAENQWGLAPLTSQECEELQSISTIDDRIQDIVDHWLDVWVSAGQSPRGRDLALLKRMVSCWKTAPEHHRSSWWARHGFARIKRPPSESSISDMQP